MSKDFVFDLETVATCDKAVVLSMAVLSVDFETEFEFADLVKKAHFIKLKADEQVSKYGRVVDIETVKWWNSQPENLKKTSFYPKETDLSLSDGIKALNDVLAAEGFDRQRSIVWTRGAFDSNIAASCAKDVKVVEVFPFYRVRDIRTAIDILSGSNNGYCRIGKPLIGMEKHNPVHDVCRDAMMLKYWTEEAF